jgi:hypothetical protein
MKTILLKLLKLLLGFRTLGVGFFGGFILGTSYWERHFAAALVGHPHMARWETGEIPFGLVGSVVGLHRKPGVP